MTARPPRFLPAVLAATAIVLTATAGAAQPASTPAAAIHAAVYDNNYWRTDAEKARDPARKPEEVLNFFGIRPDMTVLENDPGAGWYAHILAPLLKARGTYYAALPASELMLPIIEADRRERFVADNKDWQARFGEVNARLAGPRAKAFFLGVEPTAPGYLASASVDAVVDIRSVHNLIHAGPEQTDKVFAEMYRVLKPGGVLGIVDHRENEAGARAPAEAAAKGYVKESVMIAAARKAGFKLEARSDILSNPKDTKDYEIGVWALPPTLALGEKDRAKYVAIGESDRMLLKFVKPAK